MDEAENVPVKVFISYSHDSADHKRWVGELASTLVTKGVEVILDQWDTGPGDDLYRFMQNSLIRANRVLVICTEAYVHKANDGTGGVGYESMILTGELVKDLATTKFIPVIRQTGQKPMLPTFLATRFYINLNDDDPVQFEELLRELHQAPALLKPPLGVNPYAKSPSGMELPGSVINVDLNKVMNPGEAYKTAITVARSDDIMQWRELTRNARKSAHESLNTWRLANENYDSQSKEDIVKQTLVGVQSFSPLIAIALAGVASGRSKFATQLALLDDILNPKDWNRSGFVRIVEIPKAAAFIYQALHGAMCLYTDQVTQAVEMVRSSIKLTDYPEQIEIWRVHEIIGWPTSFTHNSTVAWEVLVSLPEEMPWIINVFGDSDDYMAALAAYYLVLNIQEYSQALKNNRENTLTRDSFHLDTPLFFEYASADVKRRAYNLLLQNIDQIKAIWSSLGVDELRFAKSWSAWTTLCFEWLNSNGRYWGTRQMLHTDLVKDLHLNELPF